MTTYRLIKMNPDRTNSSIEDVACSSDYEAIQVARTQAGGFGIEVWQHGRFIDWLPPSASQRQAA